MSYSKESSYTTWSGVDDLVAKPVLGSDGAASWQNFVKDSDKIMRSRLSSSLSSSNPQNHSTAPQMMLKKADKHIFSNLHEERAHEEKMREQKGSESMGSGYTHFKKRGLDEGEEELSEALTPRIRPDNKTYYYPTETFEGYKEDYIFTTRHRGTGYYWDGMDSLRKRIRMQNGTVSEEATITQPETSPPKTEKIHKTKRKKEKLNGVPDTDDPNINNPYEQVADAIRKRNEKVALASIGWVATIDPSTQKTYYYNSKTRETTWDNPLLPKQKEHQKQKSSQSKDMEGAETNKLPKGWKSTLDKASGKVYYYNTVTKETSWKIPKE